MRTPYALETSRFAKSLSRGKDALVLAANSFWEGVLSVLIPKTLESVLSNLAIPAWYAVNSFVQPAVKAAGKNASTTLFLPRKLDSVTFWPVVEGSVKSGAMSPTLSCVWGGVNACWAYRPVARSPPSRTTDSFISTSRIRAYHHR